MHLEPLAALPHPRLFLWFVLGPLLAGCGSGPLASPQTAVPVEPSPSVDVTIDDGWRFLRDDAPAAAAVTFDDSRWQPVTIPHTWNAFDGQDGGNDYHRGPAWYRRHLAVSADLARKQLFLRFEAACLTTDVYVNGHRAGSHRGAFGAFCFDVTPLLHAGDNVLAVRVDNSPSPAIPPLSGDFTMFGGLYRPVHLLALADTHISPLDDASPGVYLQPGTITDAAAELTATVELRTTAPAEESVDVTCSVIDATGAESASASLAQTLPPHGTAEAQLHLVVPQPHRWNGLSDPYLYQAVIELKQNGQLLDRVVQPLGFRTYRLDATDGFILNDHPYPLHGAAVHQDFQDKGWARSPADLALTYQIIGEIGANAVRLAHYQHSDDEYALCDRRGLAVWAEAGLVNRINDTDAFATNAQQQLRELVKQNFNHPSILFWSLYNELGPRTRRDWSLVNRLNDLVHRLDPTRVTVAASHLPATIPVNGIPDAIAFNRYFGWYTATVDVWPDELDRLHATLPNRAVGISEYGAGASVAQHENHPTTQPALTGPWHPEEWQASVHEAAYAALKQRRWLWGTFVWAMFDFAADDRHEGDHPGRNDKGLVTMDRQTRKDAFYFYKANWSPDPFVYITSRRFNPRGAGLVPLKVYSNCDTVELRLNGQPLGRRSDANHVFVWDQVPLPIGQVQVTAIGTRGTQTYTDHCTWTVLPKRPATGPTMPAH